MKGINKVFKKIHNFVINNKIAVILIIGIIVLLIVGSILFYNIFIKKDTKILEESDVESVEELSHIQKEIIGVPKTKSKIEKEQQKTYSDEYTKYENLSKEEKEKLDVIPRKEEVPFSEIKEIKEEINYSEEDVIPPNYNLKEHINIKVENQGSYGLCWDFASMKSLETNLLLRSGQDLDLSEIHLDYHQSNLMYGFREIHNGGNFSDFVNYSLLSGAVLESDAEYRDYNESEYKQFTSINSVARATEVTDFPSIRKTNGKVEDISEEELQQFRNVVKSHIMKNGSLYTSIESSYQLNSYCNDNCNVDHAVSIVGWDDNYSRDNFTSSDGSKPIHDGAYIILNSWGTSFGNGGYYYISYDDQNVEQQISGVISTSMDNAIKINDIQNPYVKSIIYDQLKYAIINYNNDEYITKAALNRIYSIDLKGKNITSEDLNGLEIFSNVSLIDLSNNNITDIGVLSNLNRLSSVDLSNNKISDVSNLANLDNLYTIILSGNLGVVGYDKLTKLDALDLSNTNLVNLSNLDGIKDLKHLSLSNNTQLNYSEIKIPSSVSTIELDNTNFSNSNIFKNLNNLYSLSIKNNKLSDLKSLEGMQHLMKLDVSDNQIKDFSLINKIFKRSNDEVTIGEYDEYYTSLIAKNNNIDDISIINDIRVNNVDLSKNKITDISKFKNDSIENLHLSYNKINTGLNSLENVKNIYLDYCDISDIKDLAAAKKAEYINLDNNKITDLNALSNLENLSSISASNNLIEDLSELSNFNKLEGLNLDNNRIKNVTPLNQIKTLNSLSLVGNKDITGKLTGNILYLNLSDCGINNDFDFSSLDKLSYINISNNSDFTSIYNLINNSKAEWLTIEAKGLKVSEDQLLKINESDNNTVDWSLQYANLDINLSLNHDNTINLKDKYYIRKILMQQINNSNLKIDNGSIDSSVEKIYVSDINKNKVSFETYSNINNYTNLSINVYY